MSEEMSERELLLEILSRQKDLEKRMQWLEQMVQFQNLMTYPIRTEPFEPPVIDVTPQVAPRPPSRTSAAGPDLRGHSVSVDGASINGGLWS